MSTVHFMICCEHSRGGTAVAGTAVYSCNSNGIVDFTVRSTVSVSHGMAAVGGHMASVGRVYISTDDLDRLRAERALHVQRDQ